VSPTQNAAAASSHDLEQTPWAAADKLRGRLDEIRAGIEALGQETDGFLEQILGGQT
jgi:hypothetical protein